jgi:hypothetical protein
MELVILREAAFQKRNVVRLCPFLWSIDGRGSGGP